MIKWKQLEDFPDYFISDQGEVLSIRTSKPKFLKGNILYNDRTPYLQFSLQSSKGKVNKYCHHLIMEAFVGPRDRRVIHINGDSLDNRLENLEYE